MSMLTIYKGYASPLWNKYTVSMYLYPRSPFPSPPSTPSLNPAFVENACPLQLPTLSWIWHCFYWRCPRLPAFPLDPWISHCAEDYKNLIPVEMTTSGICHRGVACPCQTHSRICSAIDCHEPGAIAFVHGGNCRCFPVLESQAIPDGRIRCPWNSDSLHRQDPL